MATLHVRNVPEKLYKRIQKLAVQDGRSLSAEVIRLLSEGLRARESRRNTAAVIARIRQQARKIELPSGWKDSAALIRAGRSR
jgi:plasmid stability protein